ncbi:hypothetical protein JHL18_15920 [Clostridium sp. YIM B02505]|uniref:Chitin-binding type-3 domain-containing protein n=1 Tax=Clostridium yunnanense TaxID=2800325 RepID=A0ABS1ERZ3_9CLOT|nr:carbohydrate-binding protein [Clostridium yunnanense]MBK1812110.1 hypothetical protein [Clostridium yunnanense]
MSTKKCFKRILTALLIAFMTITLLPTAKVFAAASGIPGVPVLSSNQSGGDYDGNYDISVNLWYGNNGTSYKLYERLGISGDYKVVSQGALQDNSPNPQSFVIPIRNRSAIGTYNYYVQLINSYGTSTSSTLGVQVGKDGGTKILIDGIDNDGVKLQYTIPQGSKDYKITNSNNSSSSFKVISSNSASVKATMISGNTVRFEGLAAGRSGIKIVDQVTGEVRQFGIRVKKADGTLPGMPDYVSVGQVSEDTDSDLNFWKDTSTDDKNKRSDIRYIYINGGPTNGWRTWSTEEGARAKSYITESLKLGMIPFFVYYNIPDGSESYDVDKAHINDKAYMEAYFKDLKFLLDICAQYGGDETIGLLFEPDFLGYMMQQSGTTPDKISAVVDAAYSSGILDKTKDPTFGNNVNGLVQAINYTVRKYYKTAYFGWQFNIWSYSGQVPSKGLLHKTEDVGWDAGRQFIKQAATETANFYMAAGITSNGADFISIDKYGLDGAAESGAKDNPQASTWFWNSDIWNNYLLYVKTLNEQTKKPAILWQLPVGRINSTLEANPYNGGSFADLTDAIGSYEDSASTYFFGDSFKPGAGNRATYFGKSDAKDPKITISGDTVTWGAHMQEAKDAGIISLLFGAGVGPSTHATGSPAPDGYWWITKAQRYLKNPIKLNSTNVNTLKAASLSAGTVSNGSYTLTAVVPAYNTATSYKIFEGAAQIASGTLTAGNTSTVTLTKQITGKSTGSYDYTVVVYDSLSLSATSNKVTVTVGASNTLKAASLAVGTVTNGSYALTAVIPANNTATSYKLFEGTNQIATGTLTAGNSSSVTLTNQVTGKSAGNYDYTFVVYDASNLSAISNKITVTVGNSNTLKAATLSASTVTSGAYTLTAVVSANNTATSYKFFEGANQIATGTLTAGNTSSVTLTTQISNKAAGSYSYTIVLYDAAGKSITSNTVTVTVASQGYPAWTAGATYKTGDIVSYNGVNYICLQGHTALAGWEPPVVAALWKAV